METYYQKHKDETAKYQRKYKQDHKDEMVKYQRKYYQKHKDEIVKYQRKYRQDHKDEMVKYQKEYRQDHKDEIAECQIKRKIERPYKKLGDFLTRRLKELNKNQSWLAEQIGVSKESASKYSAGVYFPRDKLRRRLCEVLEIEISDLEKMVENQNGRS